MGGPPVLCSGLVAGPMQSSWKEAGALGPQAWLTPSQSQVSTNVVVGDFGAGFEA